MTIQSPIYWASSRKPHTVFNYDRQLNLLPANSPLTRRYAQNSYEPYIQDIWKIRPNLTLTFGLRYSLFSPVWETNGLQVCPSPALGSWFNNRAKAGANGIPSNQDTPLQVDWCGRANGKKGYWNWDYGNLGPHFAFAWAPNKTEGFLGKLFGSGNKTSIRGGFGMVYDRFGQGIIDEFNGNSFGLTTSLTNPITTAEQFAPVDRCQRHSAQPSPATSRGSELPADNTDYAGAQRVRLRRQLGYFVENPLFVLRRLFRGA